jgi:aromatic-L-amino-acid/L-tryptophan decarboxylase
LHSFRAAIQQNLDHAQRLAVAIEDSALLELLSPVELSAVCFRHLLNKDASEETRNRFNLALLKRIVARGRVYLSNAELKEKFCLRACIENHLTSRLRKESVRVEIGGIFGDTKPSPATLLALLGQLCAICFSRFLAQTTFSATC